VDNHFTLLLYTPIKETTKAHNNANKSQLLTYLETLEMVGEKKKEEKKIKKIYSEVTTVILYSKNTTF
jgi:uncharacterized protein (UPF0335 family)